MELFRRHPEKVLRELLAEIEAFQRRILTPHKISIGADQTVAGKKYYLRQLMTKYLQFLLMLFRKTNRELPALVSDARGKAPLFTRETLAAEQRLWKEDDTYIDATRDLKRLSWRASTVLERITSDLDAMNKRLKEYQAMVSKTAMRDAA